MRYKSAPPLSWRNAVLVLVSLLFIFQPLLSVAQPESAAATRGEHRVALVIGNGDYQKVQPLLSNPPNDARLIATTLKTLGFEIVGEKTGEALINADRKTMLRAIHRFGDQLQHYGFQSVGLFFYAGHAVQSSGKNYLIPTDADISREDELESEAVSSDSILTQMRYSRSSVNLIILDACRDNPFRSISGWATRGLTNVRGLAPADTSQMFGTLIEYSAAPGEVALDGSGSNSPFTIALVQTMVIPNLEIVQVFKRVRTSVLSMTSNRQRPWESSSITGDFYFITSATAQPGAVATPIPSQASPPTAFRGGKSDVTAKSLNDDELRRHVGDTPHYEPSVIVVPGPSVTPTETSSNTDESTDISGKHEAPPTTNNFITYPSTVEPGFVGVEPGFETVKPGFVDPFRPSHPSFPSIMGKVNNSIKTIPSIEQVNGARADRRKQDSGDHVMTEPTNNNSQRVNSNSRVHRRVMIPPEVNSNSRVHRRVMIPPD